MWDHTQPWYDPLPALDAERLRTWRPDPERLAQWAARAELRARPFRRRAISERMLHTPIR